MNNPHDLRRFSKRRRKPPDQQHPQYDHGKHSEWLVERAEPALRESHAASEGGQAGLPVEEGVSLEDLETAMVRREGWELCFGDLVGGGGGGGR